MHTVRVMPTDAWWVVRSDAIDNDLMFKSGARAEEAAKRLAVALASAGDPVKLHIHSRDGTIAGRFVCAPNESTVPPRVAARTRELVPA